MRPRWYWILVAGCAGCAGWAGCTSSVALEDLKPVPDHFNANLDMMMRSVAHPCASDVDFFDGQIVVHYRYVYDPLGRPQSDIAVDPTGAPHERIDYTWDNAGHLTNWRNESMAGHWLQLGTSLYDTPGRLVRSRLTTSDTDPADGLPIASTQNTLDYADFDALGHAAHGTELVEDLDTQTSQTLSNSYSYDDLGRLTRMEGRSASGEVIQSQQHVYDDVALTFTWEIHLSPIATGTFGGTVRGVVQYDADGHWLSTHQENRGLDGAITTSDTVVTWDGDRQLSEVTTSTPAEHGWALHYMRTYKYQCDPSTDPIDASTMPSSLERPRHRRYSDCRHGRVSPWSIMMPSHPGLPRRPAGSSRS